jgi:ankyrin repeat protein
MTLYAGCDVNLPDSAGNTPLLIACSQGNEAIVDALLSHPKIDINHGILQFPLQAAAGVGSYVIVERLIKAGCDINKVSSTGRILHAAR